jgi:two-component system nitrate/nitrite response regulator NarL
MNVLIVDDHKIIRDSIKLVLKLNFNFGYIDVATNGLEAVDMVSEKHYDLVLMDISMPVMDGVTATQKIMSKKGNEKIKILGVSMHTNQLDIDKMKAAGARGYLIKEKIGEHLKWAIEQMLSNAPFFIISFED